MDVPGTVFYLEPLDNNKYATEIIENPSNRNRKCYIPQVAPVSVLRIRQDQQPKGPPTLVQFGQHERNDVMLNNRFSGDDQCYFDFNQETGELLLHDISEKNDTELYAVAEINKDSRKWEAPGSPQIWKSSRQCVVLLAYDPYIKAEQTWIFKVHEALFHVIPHRTKIRMQQCPLRSLHLPTNLIPRIQEEVDTKEAWHKNTYARLLPAQRERKQLELRTGAAIPNDASATEKAPKSRVSSTRKSEGVLRRARGSRIAKNASSQAEEASPPAPGRGPSENPSTIEDLGDDAVAATRQRNPRRKAYKKVQASRRLAGQPLEYGML